MALTARPRIEVRSTGNNNNSGLFNPAIVSAGTDYTLQDAAQVTIDGVTITATVHTTTTRINVVGYTVQAADIGNSLRILAGTATAGTYDITGIETAAGANRWIVDRAAGASTNTITSGTVGGAWALPQNISILTGASAATNALMWVRAATYTPTANITLSNGTRIKGYGTTRGDGGAFTYQMGASIFAISTESLENIVYDCNSVNSGVSRLTANKYGRNLKVINLLNGAAIVGTANGTIVDCYVSGSTSGSGAAFSGAGQFVRCVAEDVPTGFTGAAITFINCLAVNNTTGFLCSSDSFDRTFVGCTAESCTTGFSVPIANIESYFERCLATNCTTGFSSAGTANNQAGHLVDCAGYNNGTNVSGTFFTNDNFVALTVDPYNNAAGGDYSINNAGAGGGLLRVPWENNNYATTVGNLVIGGIGIPEDDVVIPATGQRFPT